MTLFQLLGSRSRLFYMFLVLLSLARSLANIGILMVINMVLGGTHLLWFGHNTELWFVLLIVVSFLVSFLFQNRMVVLTNKMMYDLELSLIQKVRGSSYEFFERVGSEKLYAAIGDIRTLARFPEAAVTLINAFVIIVCSLLYLFWISIWSCITVIGVMAMLLVIYLQRNKKIEKDMNKVRDLQDSYYCLLRDLLGGFKQVKISRLRNNNLYNNFIATNRIQSEMLNVRATKKYVVNEMIGTYSWYIVLGVVVFILPFFFRIGVPEMTAFITAVLFMMSPVSQLISLFQYYTSLRIALERIMKIYTTINVDALPVPKDIPPVATFNSLRFKDLVYTYEVENAKGFELHLTDFTVSNEEVIFITGGNGSGKSTFINILTGLYKPVSGKIFIDEKEVSWSEFCEFSNNMAVIFTNHHLFVENYDEHDLSEHNESLGFWTGLLNLGGIFKVDRSKDRVDTNLSKGQQKRLSLLLALLEEKPILILDEWAAEQDARNRESFYTQWLEIMRSKGKTIIAVSHDDDFFHVADRLFRLQAGKISSEPDLAHAVI